MTLAIALSLVLIVSTATLLYQYWTSALAGRDGESAGAFPVRPQRPSRIDARPRPDDGGFRADTAA